MTRVLANLSRIPKMRCKRCGCLYTNHAKTPPCYCCVCSCKAFVPYPVEKTA